MNKDIEKYLEGLSPELQEKARGLKTMDELYAFLAENDLELSEEALELVAGGKCGNSEPRKCPKCGSTNIKSSHTGGCGIYEYCGDCGHTITYSCGA